MRKIVLSLFLSATLFGVSYADTVVSGSAAISGSILQSDAHSVLLRADDGDTLYSLSDIQGFAYDGQAVMVTTATGEKKIGYLEGANSAEVIFRFDGELTSLSASDISLISPYSARRSAYSEFGLINGLLALSYSPLNLQLADISSGESLPAVGYTGGVYWDVRAFLSDKLAIGFGAEIRYLPTLTTTLVDTETNIAYGELSADTVKVGIPLGIYFEANSKLEFGVSVTPILNVTSVYQSYNTNSVDNVYITHTTFGLRPALEARYTLFNSIRLGLSVGYELLSTPDGLYVDLKTGILY